MGYSKKNPQPIQFIELKEFKRDVKKLKKKAPSLVEDVEVIIKYLKYREYIDAINLEPSPYGRKISKLGKHIALPIFKTRLASRSVRGGRGRSSFRLIYAYDKKRKIITLIELYHKSDQENENRRRIDKHFTRR